jgi:hypothetical protein
MKFDQDPAEKWLEYWTLKRAQKRQVAAFIRKSYPDASARDIVSGVYMAVERKGFLVGVVFDMEKGYAEVNHV